MNIVFCCIYSKTRKFSDCFAALLGNSNVIRARYRIDYVKRD